MRIATLTKSYPAPGSPAEGSFIASRMAAVARRAEVRVLHAVPWTRALPPDDPDGTPPVERVPYRYVPGILKGLDHRFLARSVEDRLRSWRAAGVLDILDSHFGYPEGAAAVELGARLGVPVAVTLRGTEKAFLGRGSRGAAMAEAIRRADLVVAVCGALADLALGCGADPDRVRVIGNGADLRRFSPGDRKAARRRVGLEGAAPVILSVGMLIERKGHHHLIRLLPAIARRHPGVRLVLVGSGPWEGRLRRLAARCGVTDRVEFAGIRGRDEMPDFYRAADVLALATRWEGWANVYLEAFATGIPVVTTDAGGAREAVPGEHLGLVVPVGDTGAFEQALLNALSRDWESGPILAWAEANTWDRVGDRVHEAFRELLVSS